MTDAVPTLSSSILQHDVHAFLSRYIDLLASGENLTLPHSLISDYILAEWTDIFQAMGLPSTPKFLQALTHLWASIAKTLPDGFEGDYIGLVQDQLRRAVVDKTQVSEGDDDIPGQGPVTVALTDDYADVAEIERKLPGEAGLSVAIQQAVTDGNAQLALLYILSSLRHGKVLSLPLVTEMTLVEKQWRDYFKEQFALSIAAAPLREISKRWRYLLLFYGMPRKKSDYRKLYLDQLKTHKFLFR